MDSCRRSDKSILNQPRVIEKLPYLYSLKSEENL